MTEDTADRFVPGDKALRMGDDIACYGIHRFEVYEVERYLPKAIDGLFLKGVPVGLNPQNFERLPN